MRRRTVAGLALAAAVVVTSAAYAAYAGTTANPASTITAAPDWTAPTSSASTIARSAGCTPTTPGYLKQGGTYYVYAAVTDTGNPASGVSTVTANESAVTTGQTAVALAAASFSVGGTSYTHRTAAQTANAALAAGSKTYSLALADVAANSSSQMGLTVTVDNTAPTASDNQLTNKAGGTAGRAEAGDLATLTFSEPVEPCSVLAGWDGTSTSVTVRLTNNGNNDTLTVWNAANTTQLNLGSIAAGANYVSASATFSPSTMVASGSTVTITLGTMTAGTVVTSGANAASIWTPSASAYDRAQNAMSTATNTESGTSDSNF
jgi:hypothetical protein